MVLLVQHGLGLHQVKGLVIEVYLEPRMTSA